MKNLEDRIVVITGAGSGIGRALAFAMAHEGARLAISDINDDTLAEAASELEAMGADVFAETLDVADRDAVYAHAAAVKERFGGAHVIVNNAGVSVRATVDDIEYDDFEWLMNINFWGVVYGTKAFLPLLKAADEGHIVNISSVFGIIGIPTQSAYNASKFAVRGFTESLRQEMELEGTNVGVTSVHPGGIKTNIARASRIREMSQFEDTVDVRVGFDAVARTSPESAAKSIIGAIRKNAPRLLIGADAYLIDRVQRSLPVLHRKLVMRAFWQTTQKKS